jgi:threonyl-tRNA synthetase
VQVRVLTVSDRFADYARNVVDALRADGVRAEVATSDETLGKLIRQATGEKIPNVLVVGEQEVEDQTVTLRRHGQREQETMAADDFRARIRDAIATRAKSLR